MRPLSGRTIALLESRQRDELARMVTRLGGTPVVAPAVSEVPSAQDAGPLLTRLAQGDFVMAVFLTGAGVRALFAAAESRGLLDETRQALTRMMIVTRGPKPQTALKRYGLTAGVSTIKPHTSRELIEALASTPVSGRSVMLVHYGERSTELAVALRAQGAIVEDVCLYEWALPDDLAPLHDVVRRAIDGSIDALLVTSQIQFRFLLEIATAAGMAEAFIASLNDHVIVGAVGPVCASALRSAGVVPDVLPASASSASLIGAVADYFDLTHDKGTPT